MADRRLSGSLALTKLKCVRFTHKGKSGKETVGLFIPIEANYLVEGEKADDGSIPIYLPISLVVKDEQDQYKQNGFIAKTIDSRMWKAMTDEQKEESKSATPILGSVKDWSQQSPSNQDTAGTPAETFDENDDLPF
jgi:hypothetical protein